MDINPTIPLSLWTILGAVSTLVSVSVMIGWHAFKMKRVVNDNISQNNVNHVKQMEALKTQSDSLMAVMAKQNELLGKILCLTRVHVMNIGNPDFKYTRQCEDDRQ